jgi:ABC-2 type transport system permease protein
MQNKMFIVLKHEFLKEVRSKGYVIMTLIAPIILIALGTLPALITSLNLSETTKIAVIDETGKFAGQLRLDSATHVSFEHVGTASATTIDSLRSLIEEKKLDGYIRIPHNAISDMNARISLSLRNTSDFDTRRDIERSLASVILNERLAVYGISNTLIDSISPGENSVEVLKVTSSKETEDSGIGFVAGYFTGFILYISLLIHGSLMMQSVIEEKSTRVIELIVSSIPPRDLMLGKIFGVCLAGMLQIAVWALMFAALSFLALPALAVSIGPSLAAVITPASLIYFVLYFVGGFLIYATLYATVGAMVEQASDAQSLALPITFLVVIAIISMTSVIQNPSTTASVILSLVPFFSPILMMGRIYSETPPFWQIALSFVLMGLTFYMISSFASKIYRTGILMYGKKFTFKEAFRWAKYS